MCLPAHLHLLIMMVGGMEPEEGYERRRPRKLRVKVKTNRGVDFITAVRAEATISDLANRALSVYMELSEDGRGAGAKKQLTVSAVKQGIFYMPKSELVASLLNCDDEVEVVIIKAKPKYPNQLFQNPQPLPPLPRLTPPVPLQPPQPPSPQPQPTHAVAPSLPEEAQDLNDKVSMSSKRQRKREKKQEKQRLKQQAKHKQQETQKPEKQPKQQNIPPKSHSKNELLSESKPQKEAEVAPEGPRKRLKFEKDEAGQKPTPTPLVVPSPKITFHNEPRLESPKFALLTESSKKKWEGQVRKPSEELEKRSQLEKVISPIFASKSPLIYQRSPNVPPGDTKNKEREELGNFSLSFRKISEDKKVETKKDDLRQEKARDDLSPRKEDLKNSLKKDEEKKPVAAPQEKIPEKMEAEKEEKPLVEKKSDLAKPKPAASMIVVEQSDSDSEESKKLSGPNVHHRQKQLSEIQQKISEFFIHSDED